MCNFDVQKIHFDLHIKNTLVLVFTGRNEVLAKVMFLHVSVILLTEGGGACSNFSGGGACSNFSGGVPAPIFRGGCLLQFFGGGACSNFSGGVPAPYFRNTVTVRPVRILLECILVCLIISQQI